jgi:plasmid stability protein
VSCLFSETLYLVAAGQRRCEMAEVEVRGLEDWVVVSLLHQAKRNGRSLEEELRAILKEAALRPQHEFAKAAAAFQAEIAAKYGVMEDSTPYIRADRDERG